MILKEICGRFLQKFLALFWPCFYEIYKEVLSLNKSDVLKVSDRVGALGNLLDQQYFNCFNFKNEANRLSA